MSNRLPPPPPPPPGTPPPPPPSPGVLPHAQPRGWRGWSRRRKIAVAVIGLIAVLAVISASKRTLPPTAVATTPPAPSAVATTAPAPSAVATTAPAITFAPTTATTPTPVGFISRQTFDGVWPLTVEFGTLRCERAFSVVFRAPDGTDYAVNGLAASDYPEIRPIWADDPSIPGSKINIGPLIDLGLTLC